MPKEPRYYAEYHQAANDPRLLSAPFYALVISAAMTADADNLARFKAAWPELVEETAARYYVPGGVLPGDGQYLWQKHVRDLGGIDAARRYYEKAAKEAPKYAEWYEIPPE